MKKYLAPAVLIASGLVLGVTSMAQGEGPGDQVCAALDTGHLGAGAQTSLEIQAPQGMQIDEYCVKAGSENNEEGPEYYTVAPPAASVVISHSSGKQISHYSVSYVDEPEPAPTPVDSVPDTEPPPTDSVPDTEPPPTDSVPDTEPPATEPPATEPPATEPPATEPPATEPPATEPIATEPPPTEPATTLGGAVLPESGTAAPTTLASPPSELPTTGAEDRAMAAFALVALGIGWMLILVSRRRTDEVA